MEKYAHFFLPISSYWRGRAGGNQLRTYHNSGIISVSINSERTSRMNTERGVCTSLSSACFPSASLSDSRRTPPTTIGQNRIFQVFFFVCILEYFQIKSHAVFNFFKVTFIFTFSWHTGAKSNSYLYFIIVHFIKPYRSSAFLNWISVKFYETDSTLI